MTQLAILTYPDPGLKRPCAPVTDFDGGLATLAADLLETMQAAPGIGITAAHVGVFSRVSVIQLAPDEPVRVHVNPAITWSSEDLAGYQEGSVSMPGVTDLVTRPQAIRFTYQDLEGVVHEESADGLLAVCVQHEIDQLDGVFFLDRLSRLKRERLVKKW